MLVELGQIRHVFIYIVELLPLRGSCEKNTSIAALDGVLLARWGIAGSRVNLFYVSHGEGLEELLGQVQVLSSDSDGGRCEVGSNFSMCFGLWWCHYWFGLCVVLLLGGSWLIFSLREPCIRVALSPLLLRCESTHGSLDDTSLSRHEEVETTLEERFGDHI